MSIFSEAMVKGKSSRINKVEYEDVHGEKSTAMMYGLEARIFLHEYDHMEGKDFTDRVSKLKLDIAKKKQKKHLSKHH